ncbi:MAG: hypothetical protein N0C84_09820 [Candidatus Thiodiazotropha taylori]|uniref:Uncharacterized protein n=1 Tax=Candidatus Thiodiazotropha taylori TaxID=2792791 RepID=A0A9E4KD05_9GAMM|nr:hypothetical protein [Candidatus Thiodiazotropha taylori]MCW4256744.1 hypothetical protein [Candidatus Thiodiazotropha taylori]
MAAAETLVKEIFGTIKDFIYRDIFYVIGGVSVLLSITLAFDIPLVYEGWSGLYLAVFGYVVGYVLQEIISIVGLTTTAYQQPNKLIRWFGFRFAPSEDWESLPPPEKVDLTLLRKCLDSHCGESCQKRINRTINLKQVGSSMASSLLITTGMLIVAAINHPGDTWYIPLAVSSFVLSIFLLIVNWLKQTQQNIMQLEVNRVCEECKGNATKG